MANRVSYIIQLQDRFSRSAGRISRQMQGIDRNADRAAQTINRRLSGSFNNLANVAKNALGGVIAAFSVREFITRGAAFQDSLADLSAITGATGKDLSNLSDETLRLAKASITSQTGVAEAIKLVASAKPELLDNLSALTATTEQVLLLKNAGVELSVAALVTAEGLNVFGEGAEFAARNVNILAAGSKLGSSAIADTAEAVKIAGPGAKAAGLSFLQLNAAIQTVAKGGIKASQAGTALNAIFGRLRRLGIDFQKIGLQGSFELVKKALDGVEDSTARAQLEAKIFGEEHAKVGLAMLNNVGFLGKFEKSLAGTNVAQEQADIRLKTFSSRMRLFGIILNEKIINTFERLEPVISKQVEDLGKWFDTIDADKIDAFAESLVTLANAVEIIGKGFGFVGKAFNFIGTGIGEAIGFFELQLTGQGQLLDNLEKLETQRGTTAENVGGGVIRSQADVNVNLRAPEGVIESVKSKMSGNRSGLNMGVNMVAE